LLKEKRMSGRATKETANEREHALAVVQGGQLAIPTLLGQAAPRIPVAGRIRAGIKVLTKRAAEQQRAREIYDEGVAAGKGFETIERLIAQALPDLKNPLTPKNVPYFTVRGEDFPNPEVARQIMELYSEEKDDGVRRLYRFPVIFPADAWQTVMPHELVAWTASERRFWSEYSEDGATRHCMTHAPVPVDANGRRAIRIWGGRKKVHRTDNGGLCDPESCREYQEKKCNLSGRFIFFIPGVRSISAFELPTNSFYAMNAAIQRFQTIGFMRGGRISGFLDGKHTPFYISKRLVDVPRIDDEGRAVRTPQWLIELEAPVDVTALLRSDEGLDAAEARAGDAVTVLDGSAAGRVAAAGTDVDPVIDAEPRRVTPTAADARAQRPPANRGKPTSDSPATTGATSVSPVGRHGAQTNQTEEVVRVLSAAAALGVSAERFERYADKRWGQGWKMNANGRKRALDEVAGFYGEGNAFRAKVDAELDVFS
jgi:hypothetical protein